jgi:hypothetical protein
MRCKVVDDGEKEEKRGCEMARAKIYADPRPGCGIVGRRT